MPSRAVAALIEWYRADMKRCSRHGQGRSVIVIYANGQTREVWGLGVRCVECRSIEISGGHAFGRLQDVARELSETVIEA